MPTNPLPALSGNALLQETARRAFLFFWEKADANTGLVSDRAANFGKDDYTIASVSATGYGLAALVSGVENHWISRNEGETRARRTLSFLINEMPHKNGWFYHFVDKRTGARAWKCEVSSMDTALLIAGAMLCGQYFLARDIRKMANALYERVGWNWMRTRDGKAPDSLLIAHGWKPERGFLRYNWDSYSEGTLLYLLGLGAAKPLPPASWTTWKREIVTYDNIQTVTGGPIFLHQMTHGFFCFKNKRDQGGWNYWASSVQATKINRQFCINNAPKRKGYGPNGWGINAGDGPRGYRAYQAVGLVGEKEDGTLSPSGVLGSLPFTPALCREAADAMYTTYGAKLWGRFGFANAFNLTKNWFGQDVIGIDLGMALLAIENERTGLFWKRMETHPAAKRAFARAGLKRDPVLLGEERVKAG